KRSLAAPTLPSLALARSASVMAKRSSSVSLLMMTLRSLATWRAKGLPGPPGLPLAKRPLASWLLLGVCAAGSVWGVVLMGVLLQGVRRRGDGTGGACAPSVIILRAAARRE